MSIVRFRATLLVLSALGALSTMEALWLGSWRVALGLYLIASVGLSLLIVCRARWDTGAEPARVRRRQPRHAGQMQPVPVAEGGRKTD